MHAQKCSRGGVVRKVYEFSKRHINYKLGAAAGIIGGGIVTWINWDYGPWPAGFAFAKQFAYNVLIAGYNTKTCEKITKRMGNRWGAYALGTIVPTVQAFAMVYAIHKLGGTPEPFSSTIWQVYVNFPTFAALSYYYYKNK